MKSSNSNRGRHRALVFRTPLRSTSRADFAVLPVADVPKHLDQMASFAGSRKLYLQEVGYPASELLGSSEESQKQFVDAVFDWSGAHKSQLAGLCSFLLLDISDAFVNRLNSYYGVQDKNFTAYLATLGFEKKDGAPRPAWAEFRKRAAGF